MLMTMQRIDNKGYRLLLPASVLALGLTVSAPSRGVIPVMDYITEIWTWGGYLLQGEQLLQEIETAVDMALNVVNWPSNMLNSIMSHGNGTIGRIMGLWNKAQGISYKMDNVGNAWNNAYWEFKNIDPMNYFNRWQGMTTDTFNTNKTNMLHLSDYSRQLEQDMNNLSQVWGQAESAEGDLQISKAQAAIQNEQAKTLNNLAHLELTKAQQDLKFQQWQMQDEATKRKITYDVATDDMEASRCWLGGARCSKHW